MNPLEQGLIYAPFVPLTWKPLHKLDGPIKFNGSIHGYWINDAPYTKEQYYKHPEVVAYKLSKKISADILDI